MLTVSKTIVFDAAHYLPEYVGKCRNLHGHTWSLDVFVKRKDGDIDPDTRMVLDFKLLKEQLQTKIVELFDHRLVNDIVPYPTAECMVKAIAILLQSCLQEVATECVLVKLQLWETPDSCCIWSPE